MDTTVTASQPFSDQVSKILKTFQDTNIQATISIKCPQPKSTKIPKIIKIKDKYYSTPIDKNPKPISFTYDPNFHKISSKTTLNPQCMYNIEGYTCCYAVGILAFIPQKQVTYSRFGFSLYTDTPQANDIMYKGDQKWIFNDKMKIFIPEKSYFEPYTPKEGDIAYDQSGINLLEYKNNCFVSLFPPLTKS